MNNCPQCLSVLSRSAEVCPKCGFSMLKDVAEKLSLLGLDETLGQKF